MRGDAVVGRVVVGDDVSGGVGRGGGPCTAGTEEVGVVGDALPAGGGVGEVADAELELAGRGDAELEDVRAEEASRAVEDVFEEVGKRAPALLGGFEIGVEDVVAACPGDEPELIACRTGLCQFLASLMAFMTWARVIV